ncbi:MAG TPA: hypothetical protein VGN63_20825 [Flavisolibacter sp.]|jgi:FMN phosphatase YigB (HAD superfamily)|nr:hypothetical protein [Flavisolibacter sp.]
MKQHTIASKPTTLKLVSFDVFDTLLTRKVALPHSVFYFAALTAITEGLIGCSPEIYIRIRSEAERVSRTDQPDRQTDAPRIFNLLAKLLMISPEAANRLRDIEIEWERKLLVPVPGAEQLLEKERKEGYSIAFVSDMYWSNKEIGLFLSDANLFREGDQLLVSADHGACKDSGKLFKKLMSDNPEAKKEELRHHGNDHFVDFKGAQKAGLSCILHNRCNPTRYELLLEKFRDETNGLTSLLAGTGRLLRLNHDNEAAHTAGIARIVGNVVGPTMVMYVLWILKEARNRGIKQLCFVSRDGYVPYLVCNKISKALGYEIKSVYMYGSRQSWFLPSLTEFNEASFNWIVDKYEGTTVETIFKRLHLSWQELQSLVPDLTSFFRSPDTEVTPKIQEKIKALLTGNEGLRNHILAIAKKKRGVLLSYLEQEGINYGEKTGIVEVGWSGRTRASFRKIMGRENAQNLHWFYIGLLPGKHHEQPEMINTFLHGLDIQYKGIDGLPSIAESFCFAPHGSVIDFVYQDGKVTPVFNQVGEESLDTWGRQQFFAYMDEYCDLLPLNIIRSLNYYNLRNATFSLLNAFISAPSREDAEVWGSMPFIHDQFGNTSFVLAPKVRTNRKTIQDALTYGRFNKTARGENGVWGGASWARRDWTAFPLYGFTFAGHIRAHWKSEIHRIYKETKKYISALYRFPEQ